MFFFPQSKERVVIWNIFLGGMFLYLYLCVFQYPHILRRSPALSIRLLELREMLILSRCSAVLWQVELAVLL